jgi:outer membrane cobalamin receptor
LASGILSPITGSLATDYDTPDDENRLMFDAGVTASNSLFGTATAAVFINNQDNAIVLSGETDTVNGRILELYENRDRRTYGIELDVRSRKLAHHTYLMFNSTYMRPEENSGAGMQKNPEIPGTLLNGGILNEFGSFDLNLWWKYVSAYENDRFAGDGEMHPLGNFHRFDITMGMWFGGKLRTRLYGGIENITDNAYSTVVGWPDYGRRYTIGFRQIL